MRQDQSRMEGYGRGRQEQCGAAESGRSNPSCSGFSTNCGAVEALINHESPHGASVTFSRAKRNAGEPDGLRRTVTRSVVPSGLSAMLVRSAGAGCQPVKSLLSSMTTLRPLSWSGRLASDGVFGAWIPALPAGRIVSYNITATDSAGGSTTSPTGNYTVSATPPAADFRATALISGSSVSLQWPATPGVSYSVQWSNDLTHWTNVLVGQTGSWIDPSVPASGGRRFYRVVR